MNKQNIFLYLALSLFLTGCLQTTAMVGPAFTLASTGNVSQAGVTFLTNKAIKNKTGMNTLEFVSSKIDKSKKKKKINNNSANDNNLIFLVKNSFSKKKKIILTKNQSKISN